MRGLGCFSIAPSIGYGERAGFIINGIVDIVIDFEYALCRNLIIGYGP
jgi:hypothetical protein